MDISEIFSSVNKMSLVAFIVTFGFLVYEISILIKPKSKNEKPVIPSFDPTLISQPPISASIKKPTPTNESKGSHHIVISSILVLMVIFFGFISFSSMLSSSKTSTQNQISLQEVQSSGIKIFDPNWQEIKGDATNVLAPGTAIYVGIATVKGSDIDEARIKVNQKDWSPSDITSAYNKDYNVFYKTYIIKANETKLSMEAQLHSQTNGWLTQ